MAIRKNIFLTLMILCICLCVGAIFVTQSTYAATPDVKVGVRYDKASYKPGDEVTATVYLENYKVSGKQIGSISVEVPLTTTQLTYVTGSFNSIIDKGEISINNTQNIFVFGYLPDDYAILPTDATDLFRFKMKVDNSITTSIDAKVPVKIQVGDENDNPIVNETQNWTMPIIYNVNVTGISLDKSTAALKVGESTDLTATVSPANATNKNVTWSSDKEAVATVNNGKVTAVSEGTATITVTTEDGNKTASCVVTVTKPVVAVTGVTLDKSTAALKVGESTDLTATVSPANATNKNVAWSSDKEAVATVNNGKVTAVSEGTATITVTTEDGNKTASCVVTVTKPVVAVTGVTLDKSTAALKVGESTDLAATVSPANATNKNVTWSSDKEAVATVNNGKVTAVSEGTATITVTTEDGNKTTSCVVTVTKPVVAVTGVTLDKSTAALKVGESTDLTATVSPANATNKNVTWSSDKEAVATVNNGKVTAVSEGTATITVTTEDGNKTASCVVTVTKPVVAVTGVTLDKSTAALKVGESTDLTATVSPANATNKNVTWSSDKEAVATVNNGKVTAVSEGTATITVTTEDGNKTTSCVVTVTKPVVAVTGVTLDKSTAALKVGESTDLTATVSPANATNKNVTWSSDKEAVATVNNGKVTAVSEGTAIIRVTTEDGSKTATCAVTVTKAEEPVVVVNVDSVALDKTTVTLNAGEKITLTATVKPDNASNKNVTWSSSDVSVATVKDGVISALKKGQTTITVTTVDGDKTATCSVTVTDAAVVTEIPSIVYKVHGQNYGWEKSWQKDGAVAGTTGKGLQLEALEAEITNSNGQSFDGLGISYNAHIQNVGWQEKWGSNGSDSGTTGEGLRLEAVRMKLTGAKADQYDVYYRVHVVNVGWMAWAKNGEDAGTAGFGYRAEAIQIQLVKKGEAAPAEEPVNTSNNKAFIRAENVDVMVHGQNYGWSQGWQRSDQLTWATAGSDDTTLRLEAMKLKSLDPSLKLTYRAYVQNTGWQEWVDENQVAGSMGQALRMEAFEIKATGTSADNFDIFYRAKVQNTGWTEWVKNGVTAGTIGQSLRLEALQIRVVEK